MALRDVFRRQQTSRQPLLAPPPVARNLPSPPTSPTLTLGRTVEVVGESFYADAYPRILGDKLPPINLIAVLLPEPANEFDPMAVGVNLGGLKAGHLSREDARTFRNQIDIAIGLHGVAAVAAQIVGRPGRYGVYIEPAEATPFGRQAIEAALYEAGYVNYDEDSSGFGIGHDDDGGFSVWNGGDDDDEAAGMAKALRSAGFAARVQQRSGGGKKVRVTGRR